MDYEYSVYRRILANKDASNSLSLSQRTARENNDRPTDHKLHRGELKKTSGGMKNEDGDISDDPMTSRRVRASEICFQMKKDVAIIAAIREKKERQRQRGKTCGRICDDRPSSNGRGGWFHPRR